MQRTFATARSTEFDLLAGAPAPAPDAYGGVTPRPTMAPATTGVDPACR
ncbi:hypothetical protein [Streptomyces sp. NPDC055400]